MLMATVPIQKDGQFHIAALEGGDDVRLSEDYFIEAQRDKAPEIKMTRPGRDFKASPIEEVTVAGGGQGRFRAQERGAALFREWRRRRRRSRCQVGRQDGHRDKHASRWKISRWNRATW